MGDYATISNTFVIPNAPNLVLEKPVPPIPQLPRRRQNHSCDQCRRGKRACDAGLNNQLAGEDVNGTTSYAPCSACRRSGKHCSFNWLTSNKHAQLPHRKRKRPETLPTRSKDDALDDSVHNDTSTQSSRSASTQAGLGSTNEKSSSASTYESPDLATDRLQGIGSLPSNVEYISSGYVEQPGLVQTIEDNVVNWETEQEDEQNYQSANTNVDLDNLDDLYPAGYSEEYADNTQVPVYNGSGQAYYTSNLPMQMVQQRNLQSMGTNLAQSTTRLFVSDNLLRIYHDSMENALSCWLNERNCPYNAIVPTKQHSNPLLWGQGLSPEDWGPNWSNRICTRVCRLDKAYSPIRPRPLTNKEEVLASKALRLSIMAFAAQWAQAGDRDKYNSSLFGNENLTTDSIPSFPDAAMPEWQKVRSLPTSDIFGRNLQKLLWHQAHRALSEAGGIDSFKIVFSYILFSLTQKPLDIDEQLRSMSSNKFSSQYMDFGNLAGSTSNSDRLATALADLQNITDADGPPIFLEMALRQLFAARRRIEDFDKAGTIGKGYSQLGQPKKKILSQDNMETFNLLFWLGVMFDTLSAAMTHRPLVVSDEDSMILPEKEVEPSLDAFTFENTPQTDLDGWNGTGNQGIPVDDKESEIWGSFFLKARSPSGHIRQVMTRWPCTYEEAASTLSDAAPVKVLLFRRVARLQSLISLRASSNALEIAITKAFEVYQYWNQSYGRFILDCVVNHNSLPARVQSWYLILAGHWYLATFLFADLVEKIDDTEIGGEIQRIQRQTHSWVNQMRKANAYAVADLSQRSIHGIDDRSFPNSREFHHAVNKAAMLTEPWTIVLIRCFSKAAYTLLTFIKSPSDGFQDGQWDGNGLGGYEHLGIYPHEARIRCRQCIEALWFVGKKSDMAFLAARLLTNVLEE